MNIIPFDLQKAREGHPIQTRDGRHAKFIACAEVKDNRGVVVVIDGYYQCVTETGYFYKDGKASGADLFMAPVKHTGHINIYSGSPNLEKQIYPTMDCANTAAAGIGSRIACIPIEFTEGQGLES